MRTGLARSFSTESEVEAPPRSGSWLRVERDSKMDERSPPKRPLLVLSNFETTRADNIRR